MYVKLVKGSLNYFKVSLALERAPCELARDLHDERVEQDERGCAVATVPPDIHCVDSEMGRVSVGAAVVM